MLLSPAILLFFTLFLPCGSVLAGSLGYTLTLANYKAFALFLTILSLANAVTATVFRKDAPSLTETLLQLAILLFSAVNPIFLLARAYSKVAAICMLTTFCFSCCAAVMRSKSVLLKTLSLIFGLVTPLPLGVFLLLLLTIGNLGENTVVHTVPSPSGRMEAQVVASSQGALGGDTLVTVKSTERDADFLLFEITQKPRIVYTGEWHEFERISVCFESDEVLTINGERYPL